MKNHVRFSEILPSVLVFATLFFFLGVSLEALFVPWDATTLEMRPPLTSTTRQWNDFFEAGTGAALLNLPFLILCLIFIVRLIRAKESRSTILWETAMVQAGFIGLSIIVGFLLSIMTSHDGAIRYSYPHLVSFAALWGLLAVAQAGYLPKRFKQKKT
jgi:hypothetical protein